MVGDGDSCPVQTGKSTSWEKSLPLTFLHFIPFNSSLFLPSLPFPPSHALPLLNVKGSGWCCEWLPSFPWVFIYIFMPSKVPPQPLWRCTIEKHFPRYIAWWSLAVKSMCGVTPPAVHLWLQLTHTHTYTVHYTSQTACSHYIRNCCTVHKPIVRCKDCVNLLLCRQGLQIAFKFRACAFQVVERQKREGDIWTRQTFFYRVLERCCLAL